MATRYVDVESLNFRSAPDSSQPNVIAKLSILQPVEIVASAAAGWVECDCSVGGTTTRGFVKEEFLRQPTSKHREALLASVFKQHIRFERGLGKEHVQPFSGFVGEMWKAIGNSHLDGTDRDVPWSAAAISFMVKNAGPAYTKFKFAAAHSKYIHQAIRMREKKEKTVPFWGFRLFEMKPEIGDIVARDNPDHGPHVNFDIARALDSYRSHTDIIVKIDSKNGVALAIGGNVSHSVAITRYDLAPGDFLADTNNTFALLRNITDD